MSEPIDLNERAAQFADELTVLVRTVLPKFDDLEFLALINEDRVQIGVFDEQRQLAPIPLCIGGIAIANWAYSVALEVDSFNEHLRVRKTTSALRANISKTPLLRYEFEYHMSKAPTAHWHVHAENGTLSHVLTLAQQAGKKHLQPHYLHSLHLPVGGPRMRPGLEDWLQFLVQGCGFDALGDWEKVLAESRAAYRLRQARAIARDAPFEVAEELRALGFKIEPPESVPTEPRDVLFKW